MDEFSEVEDFVHAMTSKYGLNLIETHEHFKSGLESVLKQVPTHYMVVVI